MSEPFAAWLAQAQGSLAITTYQAGKTVLVGWTGRQPFVSMRQFVRPMGLAVDGQRMALATRHEIWMLANASRLAGSYLGPDQYDALYLPRAAYFTGLINSHDMAFGSDGLWVVNTRFSCLCRLSHDYSFEPHWQPPFISELAPEDRCHLNGLAMIDGRPRYISALGRADTPRGWHADRLTGGILMDLDSSQVVADGFCMPHSPRWHENKLWILNSAMGELCTLDLATGKRTVVCALPGYLRGLTFVGHHAIIGLSRVREKYLFAGLPLQQRFDRLVCGVAAVDLRTGQCDGMLEFTSGAEELYDVQFLSGVQRPTILNMQKDAARQAIVAPNMACWLQPEDAQCDPDQSVPAPSDLTPPVR